MRASTVAPILWQVDRFVVRRRQRARRSGKPPLRSLLNSPVSRWRGLSVKYGGAKRLLIWSVVVYGEVPALALARAKRTLRGNPTLVLVSGTYGKTTATRALRALLGQEADGWADYNANFRGEVGWTILREPGRPAAYVIEKSDGSKGMDAATRWLPPDITLVLGLGEEHLDELASMAELVEVQLLTVERLQNGGRLVLNADDLHVAALASRSPVPIIWFGQHPPSGVRIERVTHVDGRLHVTLVVGERSIEVPTLLVGDHYAASVAGMVATAMALGFDPQEAAAVWAALPPTPGRMETMVAKQGARVICDDYKATPETVVAGLRSLTSQPATTHVAVLGELDHLIPGRTDEMYRDVLAACADLDALVLLGHAWDRYVDDLPPGLTVFLAPSVAAVTEYLRPLAGSGTVIYLKATEEVRLRRIALALTGHNVTCAVSTCHLKYLRCEQCARLSAEPSEPTQ